MFLYAVWQHAAAAYPEISGEVPREGFQRASPVNTKPYRIVVCSKVHLETPFLLEWVEFHRIQGVDKFALYHDALPNNADSTQDAMDLEQLATLYRDRMIGNDESSASQVRDPLIDLFPASHLAADLWPASSVLNSTTAIHHRQLQVLLLSDCVERYRHRAEWILHIDLDEFAYAPKFPSLYDFAVDWKMKRNTHLQNYLYGRAVGILLPSVNFGPSGHFWNFHNYAAADVGTGSSIAFFDPRDSFLYKALLVLSRAGTPDSFDNSTSFIVELERTINDLMEREIDSWADIPTGSSDAFERYLSRRHNKEYHLASDPQHHAIPALHPHIRKLVVQYKTLLETTGPPILPTAISTSSLLVSTMNHLAEALHSWNSFLDDVVLTKAKAAWNSSEHVFDVRLPSENIDERINRDAAFGSETPVSSKTSIETIQRDLRQTTPESASEVILADDQIFGEQDSDMPWFEIRSEPRIENAVENQQSANAATFFVPHRSENHSGRSVSQSTRSGPREAHIARANSWIAASAEFFPLISESSTLRGTAILAGLETRKEAAQIVQETLEYCKPTDIGTRAQLFRERQKKENFTENAKKAIEEEFGNRICSGWLPTGITLNGKALYDTSTMQRSDWSRRHAKLRGCLRPGVHQCSHGLNDGHLVLVKADIEARLDHHQFNTYARRSFSHPKWRAGPEGLPGKMPYFVESMKVLRVVRDESKLRFIPELRNRLSRLPVFPKFVRYRKKCKAPPPRERSLADCSPAELLTERAVMCPPEFPFVGLSQTAMIPPHPMFAYSFCTDIPQTTSVSVWSASLESATIFGSSEKGTLLNHPIPSRRVYYNATTINRNEELQVDNDLVWNNDETEFGEEISTLRECFNPEGDALYQAHLSAARIYVEQLTRNQTMQAQQFKDNLESRNLTKLVEREKQHYVFCPSFGEARCCNYNPSYEKYQRHSRLRIAAVTNTGQLEKPTFLNK